MLEAQIYRSNLPLVGFQKPSSQAAILKFVRNSYSSLIPHVIRNLQNSSKTCSLTAQLSSTDALGPNLQQHTQITWKLSLIKWYECQGGKVEVGLALQVINRPGVAFVTDSVPKSSFSSKPSKHHYTQTVKARWPPSSLKKLQVPTCHILIEHDSLKHFSDWRSNHIYFRWTQYIFLDWVLLHFS